MLLYYTLYTIICMYHVSVCIHVRIMHQLCIHDHVNCIDPCIYCVGYSPVRNLIRCDYFLYQNLSLSHWRRKVAQSYDTGSTTEMNDLQL